MDMTSGSPARLIFLLSLPLCAESAVRQLVTALANAVAGRGCGVNALAVIGATGYGYYPVNWFEFGFAQCVCVVVGQYFGSGEGKKLREAVSTCALIGLVLGAALSVLSCALAGPMLRLLRTPEDIFPAARLYLQVLCGGGVTYLVYEMYASALRALGDGRDPLIAMGIMGVLIVSLTWAFVYGLRLGAVSVALATVIAQLAAALYCLAVLRKTEVTRRQPGDRLYSPECARRVAAQGIPVGVQLSAVCVGGVVMQRALNGYGPVFIAAFTAANSLDAVFQGIQSAYGSVMNTYVSQNYGAQRFDRIRSGIGASLALSAVLSAGMTGILLVFGKRLLGAFIDSGDAAAAQTLVIGFRFVKIMAVCAAFLFLLHIFRSALIGLGGAKATLWGNAAEVVGRAGTPLLVGSLFGLPGIYYAESSAWVLAGLAHMASFFYCARTRLRRAEGEKAAARGE